MQTRGRGSVGRRGEMGRKLDKVSLSLSLSLPPLLPSFSGLDRLRSSVIRRLVSGTRWVLIGNVSTLIVQREPAGLLVIPPSEEPLLFPSPSSSSPLLMGWYI